MQAQNGSTAMETFKSFRTLRWVGMIPLLWLLLAVLSVVFPGAENLTLGLGLLPGIAMAALLKHQSIGELKFWSAEFWWLLGVGVLPAFVCGLLFDLAGVRAKTFLLALAIGVAIGHAVLGYFFFAEAARSTLADAALRFNLDQGARLLSWILFVLSLGFYLSLPLSVLAALSLDRSAR